MKRILLSLVVLINFVVAKDFNLRFDFNQFPNELIDPSKLGIENFAISIKNPGQAQDVFRSQWYSVASIKSQASHSIIIPFTIADDEIRNYILPLQPEFAQKSSLGYTYYAIYLHFSNKNIPDMTMSVNIPYNGQLTRLGFTPLLDDSVIGDGIYMDLDIDNLNSASACSNNDVIHSSDHKNLLTAPCNYIYGG